MPRSKKIVRYKKSSPIIFDFEQILEDNGALVYCKNSEWVASWVHGVLKIGKATTSQARKAAAIFMQLWHLGFDVQLARQLMRGYILYLESIENES